jgi:phenylpropionate dioxygenase-like ring-hydroxylating dioxygenase large terminal subunit
VKVEPSDRLDAPLDRPAAPAHFGRYPDGWFRVALSRDLPRGGVRPLYYLGQHLVLFRTGDGLARVFDAHCPHLGAHLGHGGRVEGEAIRCPFHGWLIDSDGRCVEVPYAGRVPGRARVRTWPVREANGVIMVYHHARGEPPTWELPELPEFVSREWTPFRPARHWRIRSHIQDLAENGIDTAHMPLVHRTQTRAIHSEVLEARGPVLVHRMAHEYRLFPLARWLGARVHGPLEITYYGLGCAVNRALVHAGIELEYLALFTFTPIDERNVEVASLYSMKKIVNRAVSRVLLAKAMREGGRTIDQDVPIFENKIHRSDPVLSAGDGPIAQYRRWARQFYSEPALGGS